MHGSNSIESLFLQLQRTIKGKNYQRLFHNMEITLAVLLGEPPYKTAIYGLECAIGG